MLYLYEQQFLMKYTEAVEKGEPKFTETMLY